MQVATVPTPLRNLTLLNVIPLAWLVFITIMYLLTAITDFSNSPGLGMKQAWPTWVTIITTVAAAGLGIGASRRQTLARLYVYSLLIGVGFLVFLVAVMFIAGGAATAVATLLWLLLLGKALGDRLLRLFFRHSGGPRGYQRAAFAIALALGFYSHAVLGLALLGLLYRLVVVAMLVLLTLLLWRDLMNTVHIIVRLLRTVMSSIIRNASAQWFTLPTLALISSWTMLVVIQAVAPELGYDALTYHLALPKIYIEQHSYITTPYNIQSWFYLGTEMNYLLGMLLADQIAAKLTNLVFVAVTCLSIYALGQRFLSRESGVLGAILYATTPLVALEETTAYIDVASACYGLLIVVATWQWLVSKHRGWLLLTGLLSGFALSTKLNAVFLLAPIAVFITIAIFADRSQTLKQRFLSLASFGTMGLLSSAPWPVLRYVQTGNPVFPLLNNVFKSPLWPEVNEHFNWAKFGIGTGLDSFFRLPWEMTFQEGTKFAEPHQVDMIGLGLLVLPVLIFGRIFGRFASRLVVFVGITLLVFSISWAYSVQYLRYFLIVLPLVYILAGYALVRIRDFSPASIHGIVTALMYGLILIWMVVSFLSYTFVAGNAPYQVAFGLESRQDYLTQTLSTYSAFEHIDQVYGKYAHILPISNEGNRLYSSGIVEPRHSSPPSGPLWDTLDNTSSYEDAANVLKQYGITHLLIKDTATSNVQSMPIVQKAFLDEYTSLEYARNEVEVYRILRDDEKSGRETKPVAVQLKNSSFEEAEGSTPTAWQPIGGPILDASGSSSHSGQAAIQASTGSGYLHNVPITPGQIYTLSDFSRSDVPGSRASLHINWLDQQGKIVDVSTKEFSVSEYWTQDELTSTAPRGAQTASIYATTDVGTVWFDDYSLLRGAK